MNGSYSGFFFFCFYIGNDTIVYMKNYFGILFLFVFVFFPLLPINSNAQSSCASLQNNLKQRDQNNEVKSLQSFLKQKGYLNTEPTGFFGTLTTKAVIDFQKANNINPAVGYVGAVTRAKIQSLDCELEINEGVQSSNVNSTEPGFLKLRPGTEKKVCTNLKNNFKIGSRDTNTNGEVSILQEFLNKNFYFDSQPTGYFGNQTEKALIDWQKAHNITPSAGYAGPSTRSKIKSITCAGIEIKEELVSTGYNQISKTILSLFESKSVSIDAILKSTNYNKYNYSTNKYEKGPILTVNISATQDILNPGNIKGKQKISISDISSLFSLLSGFSYWDSPFKNIVLEDLIIGDSVYLKIPNKLIQAFVLDDYSDTSYPGDSWIKFDPTSLAKLPTDYGLYDLKPLYKYLVSFNSQPVQFLKNHQDVILKYTQAMNSAKYSTKIVDGKQVDVYKFTLDKTALKKFMIAESKKLYYDGKVSAYALEEIDQSLESFKILDGYYSVFTNTNKPYRLNATVQLFDIYSKRLESSTFVDLTFSNYDKPLVITPPDTFTTISDFFDKYLKIARDKGTNASIKSNLSSVRGLAEIIYDQNNGSYSPVSYSGACSNAVSGSLFNSANRTENDLEMTKYIDQAQSLSQGQALCNSTPTSYAVSVKLLNNEGYWCIDSTGFAKVTNNPITGPVCNRDSSNTIPLASLNSNVVAKKGDTVSVNYTGRLQDGTVFDSNIDPNFAHVEPFLFPLGSGQVIVGWDEGIVGMKIGEKKTLVIPPDKGYGKDNVGPIPGNSTLIFDVQLLDINPSQEY